MKFESASYLPTQESVESNFNKAIENGKLNALNLIVERFGNKNRREDIMDFHNASHTQRVFDRIGKIMDVIHKSSPELVSERDRGLASLAGLFHDVVQDWEPSKIALESGDERLMRKRSVGENENRSAEEAIIFMDKENVDSGKEIFSKDDQKIVMEAIKTTVPGFDIEKKTVIQPSLKENSSIISRVLALADIGAAGMDGPDVFLQEGDNLFREDNLDIKKDIDSKNLTDEKIKLFTKRILDWTAFQSLFANGRRELFERELVGLPIEAKEAVKNLFAHFNDSITAAEERLQKRKQMSFEELAKDMGYRI